MFPRPSPVGTEPAELGLEDFFKEAARTIEDLRTLARWKAGLARSRPAIRAAFIKWRNLVALETIRGLNRNPGLTADASKILDGLTDWPALEERARDYFQGPMARALEAGQTETLPDLAKGSTIPTVSPATVYAHNWSLSNSAKLVTEITADQKNTIAELIRKGQLDGTSTKTIAAKIRPTIGLHSRQLAAVDKYRAGLEAKGIGAGKIKGLVDKRMARELRSRAETIARTETANARMAGVLEQHKKMQLKKLRWLADPQCCEICLSRSGKLYSVAEAAGQIPAHPRCECTFVVATAADLKRTPSWPFASEPPMSPGQAAAQAAKPKPKKPAKKKPEKAPEKPAAPIPEGQPLSPFLTEAEKETINRWVTSDYTEIREILAGTWKAPESWSTKFVREYKDLARTFEKTVEKYGQREGARDRVLYRGVNVDEKILEDIRKWKIQDVVEIDKAPQSWSTDEKIATWFSRAEKPNEVIFHLKQGRKSTIELDLRHEISTVEKEIVLKNTKFKLLKMTEEPGERRGRRVVRVYLEETMGKSDLSKSDQLALALSRCKDWKMIRREKKKKPRVDKRRRTMNR